MNTNRMHTICIVGAADGLAAHILALLKSEAAHLATRWEPVPQKLADVLLIDPDSVYGHMDWLRAQSTGRPVIACTNTPDAYAQDLCLRKPVIAAELVEMMNRVSAQLDGTDAAAPAPAAPPTAPRQAAATPQRPTPARAAPPPAAPTRAAAAAPAPTPAPAPAPVAQSASPPAPAPPQAPAVRAEAHLLDLLADNRSHAGKLRLHAAGLPDLFIDPIAHSWHADASLKELRGWCTRTLVASEVDILDAAGFARATAALPAQPYSRLVWLAHLVQGGGRLDPALDARGRYKLSRWPQSEREFAKHFRIATVMLKHAGTVEEIAAGSGASMEDVADFINAYHAIGYVEPEGVEAHAGEETRRGRLFGLGRKPPAAS